MTEGSGPERPGGVAAEEPAAQEQLGADEVRQRAISGAALLGVRGIAIRSVALVGTIVIARLLAPDDFGVVSFGLTLTASITFLAESGIGAGLIRRREPPDRADLSALVAFQLLALTALAVVIAAVALPFGRAGQVTAIMVAALPLAALRTPGTILLERALSYRTVVIVELAEVVAFYAWAVFTVAALDWGVWGVATAQLARTATGSAAMLALGPAGPVRPRLNMARMRPLLAFGAQYQAIGGVSVLRDQGLNLGTLAISGTGVLGLWALAYRLLQVPFLLFEGLYRVSYPAMSQLMARGEEARPLLERGLAVAAVGTVALLAPLVGSAPALVPALVGEEWREAADVIPWACLGLALGGPVSVASAGYLYAVGDAATVLRAAVLHTIAWVAVAFALLPVVGVEALGVGWLAGGLVDTVVLARAVNARTGARVVPALAAPVAVAAAAAAVGWLLASELGETIPAALAGAAVATALLLAGLLVVARAPLADAASAGRRAVRAVG